jgi:DNA-binding transcriptional MocR family regulator
MPVRRVGTTRLLELAEGWRGEQRSSWAALSSRLRLLIIDGRITAGSALPPERQLATALGLSRTTVNAAYAALRADGFLLSRRGSGSVAQVPGQPGRTVFPREGDIIDLSRATSGSVPGVHTAAQRALDRLPGRLTTDGYELSGLPDLRDAIADRFTERGLPTTPDQILVTSGAQSAISLIARTLLSRGDKVIVESPSYPHALDALRLAGARLVPVGVDPMSGWDVAGFENVTGSMHPAMAYLMPDFHNPTALSMPAEVRERIAQLAGASRTLLLIDETTAELDIDRGWAAPPLAFFGDKQDLTLTIGSASKTVWGGLRVGWIRGSKALVDRLVTARLANDLGAGVIDQLVTVEMLGGLDQIVQFRRAVHSASVRALDDAITHWQLPWNVTPVAGGISAWVHLGSPVSSMLASAARERGLLLGAGPWFGVDGAFERFIRIPITATPEMIDESMSILASVWGEFREADHRL